MMLKISDSVLEHNLENDGLPWSSEVLDRMQFPQLGECIIERVSEKQPL
jgi:hypothetical protein